MSLIEGILNGSGALGLGSVLLLGAGMLLRDLPAAVGAWFTALTTMEVTVKDDDAAFVWVKEWFLEQGFAERIRRVDLDTTIQGQEIALIPAPGHHWFWREGRAFQVAFHRSQEAKPYGRRMEWLQFRTWGRNRAVLRRFVHDIVAAHQRKLAATSRLHVYEDGWDHAPAYLPRRLESVILNRGEKAELLKDVAWFLQSRSRYRELGVPYHRGYLFYGPPGTGKTSLVSALADHFGLPIYALNLTEMNDRTLKSAVLSVPARALILFEDIDVMRGARQTVPDGEQDQGARAGVSLSGMLNVLDGFHAPQATIFVMTTNAVESLDAALLRPGRIDLRLYLGHASEHQKLEMYRRFFPQASDAAARRFVEAQTGVTMATFQNLLLRADQSPVDDAPEAVATPHFPLPLDNGAGIRTGSG